MKKINVYVMIGLPGSGKDTWIKEHLPDTVSIACRDDIRAELGLCMPGEKIVASREAENLVTGVFNAKLLQAAKEGKDVVINNINLKKRYRDGYKETLKGIPVHWIYVVVQARTLETNLERRSGQIPPDVIRNMARGYQPPERDEYDEIINVTT